MPDTSASLYEQLFALTTVMKQRVVDNFSGDSLNERWTTTNDSGTNTFAMADSVDGGFSITTGSTSGNGGSITFNNIRQYNHQGAVCLMVVNNTATSSMITDWGLSDNIARDNADQSFFRANSGNSFVNFATGNSAGTTTESATSQALTTNFLSLKIENKSSSVEGSLSGVIEVTNTTNLPTNRQQPFFQHRNQSASAETASIRYCEVYNT